MTTKVFEITSKLNSTISSNPISAAIVESAGSSSTMSPILSSPPSNGTSFLDYTPLFLQTTSAQALAGAFVWAALIITCHQVNQF